MEWRPIPLLDGAYEASDTGLIRRCRASGGTHIGRLLSVRAMPNGYWVCSPWVANKSRQSLVHRLVASAFLGPCPVGYEVNHKDLDKANNSVANLEYVTRSENLLHRAAAGIGRGTTNGTNRLSEDSVRSIRERHANGEGYKRLGAAFGVNWGTIRDIVKGRIWAWLA